MVKVKNTTSLCPTCLRKLEAEVYEEDGAIYLDRTCPEHGNFYTMVERDPNFYKLAMCRGRDCKISWVVIPITSNCNIKCKYCFYPDSLEKKLSVDDIIEISKNAPRCFIISGGEPTTHPNLDKIIAKLKENKTHCTLLTNGIKLADPRYLDSLCNAGLCDILLSLNSTDKNTLIEFEGVDTLKKKLTAIDNITDRNIRFSISFSVLKGFNEDEFKKVLFFALRKGAAGLRVRSFSHYGRYDEVKDVLFMSDLIKLLADALGYEKEFFYDNLDMITNSGTAQYVTHLLFLKKNNNFEFIVPLSEIDLDQIPECIKRKRGQKFLDDFAVRRTYGKLIFIDITMFAWPDRSNVDLEEICSHGGGHLTLNNEVEHFWPSLIGINDTIMKSACKNEKR